MAIISQLRRHVLAPGEWWRLRRGVGRPVREATFPEPILDRAHGTVEPLLVGAGRSLEVRQPALEEAPLRVVVDQRKRAAVGVAGLVGATEAPEQLAPRRVRRA